MPTSAIQRARYRFVGGKGGVGKTTCAAAMGIASARSGRPTLIISTDPAPSLGDALDQRLGSTPRPVRGVRGLYAVEVDAPAALARWIDRRRDTLENIALRGTWLDRDDVSRLLRLSLPGIDEVAGLLEVSELGEDRRYEQVIIDTAPTGHLLRMLGMPAILERLARVFDHMQAKHRIMVEALRGGWIPDAADALIAEIDARGGSLGALLRDRARAVVSWITLPEPMAVEETADGVTWLREQGIALDGVIVNRMTPPPPAPCQWCRARRQFERAAIEELTRAPALRGLPVAPVAAAPREPRGIRALAAMGIRLERPRGLPRPSRPASLISVTSNLPAGPSRPARGVARIADARLVMVGGKGGVGKTTCATAFALDAAASAPRRRVLLLSADPAHSLGDAIGQKFSDAGRRIHRGPANLTVRELDATRSFSEVRERFTEAIEQLFRRVSAAGSVGLSVASHDRQVMRDLIELAPPGVDELVAIMEITDSVLSRASQYDLIVMDTAPTGHALRLIEMPGLVHEWVKAVMGILLKYQPVVGVGELGAVLLGLSQGLGRLRDLMTDPARTLFVAITRAAELPRAETIRLLARLRTAGVSVPMVIVNAAGTGTCGRCRTERAGQQKQIAALRKALQRSKPRPAVVIAPAEIPPPHGPGRLLAWSRTWREVTEPRARGSEARGSGPKRS